MCFFELWFSVDIRPAVRLLELRAALLLVFQGTSTLFSTAQAPTCSLKVTSVGKKFPHSAEHSAFLLSYSFLKFVCNVSKGPVFGFVNFVHCFALFSFLPLFYCLPPSFCGLTMLLFFFSPNFSSYTLTPFIPSVSCFPINIVKVLISLMRCFSTNLDIVIQHKP